MLSRMRSIEVTFITADGQGLEHGKHVLEIGRVVSEANKRSSSDKSGWLAEDDLFETVTLRSS